MTPKGVTIWSQFSFSQCAIYTRNFTCVSQTSGTIRHAFPRTSGQEGSFFFFRLSLFEFFVLFIQKFRAHRQTNLGHPFYIR